MHIGSMSVWPVESENEKCLYYNGKTSIFKVLLVSVGVLEVSWVALEGF